MLRLLANTKRAFMTVNVRPNTMAAAGQMNQYPYKFGQLDRRIKKENSRLMQIATKPLLQTYKEFLHGLASGDVAQMQQICEKRLIRKFTGADLLETNRKVEVLNSDQASMDRTKIEIVDKINLYGIEIDRDTNFSKGTFNRWRIDDGVMFHNNFEVDSGDATKQIMRYDIKIQTPMKLNLIDMEGNELIPDSEKQDLETHFVRFERYKWIMQLDYFSSLLGSSSPNDGWKIVDIDNALNGNIPICDYVDQCP